MAPRVSPGRLVRTIHGRKGLFSGPLICNSLFPIMNKTKVFQYGISTALLLAMISVAPAEPTVTIAPPVPAAPATPAAPAPKDGPKITFQNAIFDFGKVKSGEPVKNTYIFTNTGTSTLIISNVAPACGCTTSGEWTRQVEPGQTGTIPIQFATVNYNGAVMKTVTVTCNDPAQNNVMLQIKGTVWKPVDVNPNFAAINVPAESQEPVKTEVRIVNNTEEPLTLSPPESNNKAFKPELVTVTPGKEYKVVISTVPPLESGNMQGQISMKSSSTDVPMVNISVWANVLAAVSVTPGQVMLPNGPLPAKQTASVTINNNTTNLITLSDAMVDVKGVEVQISELQPGKMYNAMLSFPQGFEIMPGTPVNFSVKTTHPKHPLLKVPVMQLPKLPQPTVVPLTPPVPQAAVVPAAPAARPAGQ
jgi:hypothetical protein